MDLDHHLAVFDSIHGKGKAAGVPNGCSTSLLEEGVDVAEGALKFLTDERITCTSIESHLTEEDGASRYSSCQLPDTQMTPLSISTPGALIGEEGMRF